MFMDITEYSPICLTLLGGAIAFALTSVGASAAFVFSHPSQKLLDGLLGFAAGVMIAASFFSLLSPAIEMARQVNMIAWIPATVGFILGAIFLRTIDLIVPHLHPNAPEEEVEGLPSGLRSAALLSIAMIIHNIPEGLAIGVAFGAHQIDPAQISLASAFALAIGIGIQDIPEGFAVSMPLRRAGVSKIKSFLIGMFSGLFELVFAVVGFWIVNAAQLILPYALGFAAGAMIFVTVEELVPEAQRHGNTHIATGGVMAGFVIMMILDVALG